MKPYTLLAACIIFAFVACNKKELLAEKPNTDLITLDNLPTIQAVLDNDAVLGKTPYLGELTTTDYDIPDSFLIALPTIERNAYTWEKDIFSILPSPDWDDLYQEVFYANSVLDALPKLYAEKNLAEWQRLKGSALFLRGYAFFNVAQTFAPPYDSTTAATDYGICKKLHADVDEKPVRVSVQDSYNLILNDLKEAVTLLTDFDYSHRNRPCKPAAYALLARVYLSMRKYSEAGKYADSCLQLYNTLINYNTIDTTAFYPFSIYNDEAIYQSYFTNPVLALLRTAIAGYTVDSNLYNLYAPNDLRRLIYFSKTNSITNLKGGYFPKYDCFFTGMATDEVYLIRAESAARMGNTQAAMADLNTLLKNRYKTGFTPFTANSPNVALQLILVERRKELVFRGMRFADLRRLNKEGANITLTRKVNNQTYTLLPNNPRYVMPLPPDAIAFGGYLQNQR
jgi:hypothetical protein